MRNCLREIYIRLGNRYSFCLKFWLPRYRGATPRTQSETRRELSAADANCSVVIRRAGALVRMQRREGGREVRRLSSELKIVAALNIRRENQRAKAREKERTIEKERMREGWVGGAEKCGKRRKRTGKERGKERNQSDSLDAIHTIHRSSSKHVRNCMLASSWEYWLHPAIPCRICVSGSECGNDVGALLRKRDATVNNVMHGVDVIYFALFAVFVSAPFRYVTFRDRVAIQSPRRREIVSRRWRAGNIWKALVGFSRGSNGSRVRRWEILSEGFNEKEACALVDFDFRGWENSFMSWGNSYDIWIWYAPFFAIKPRKIGNVLSI